MNEATRMSFDRWSKSAPWLCLGSLVVIAVTFLVYRKLYVVAVFLAPIAGLLMFASSVAYLRTGKEWPESLFIIVAIMLSINVPEGGFFWAFPQNLAFEVLFMALPLIVLRRPISRWFDRKSE